jgi:saccharopine dehydrogenase-like NADP-dependent oxidoreductase
MKQIVLFGAGKSATCLIDYLAAGAARGEWQAVVVDSNAAAVEQKLGSSATGVTTKELNVELDITERKVLINNANVVISLMPPWLHYLIAQDCVEAGKHLLTASYIDEKIKALEPQIKAQNLLFLCEMGLDPGIDHLSAMKLIDDIKAQGGSIHSFKSHCGGLTAPESDNNPWHYKISWNPRNVVLAGKAGAVFKEDGYEKRLGYHDLFNNIPLVNIPGLGNWAYYPNRDSLGYMPVYGLETAATFVRTTLRHPIFMQAWQQVANLGLADEAPVYETKGMSLAAFFERHCAHTGGGEWLANFIYRTRHSEAPLSEADAALLLLGLNDSQTIIEKETASAAGILQWVLERQLKLAPADKDMILMMHEIGYTLNGAEKSLKSWLVVKGDDAVRTAMAKTVGLPLGIAAKLILNGVITKTGLQIPVSRDIYEPVLAGLAQQGIVFEEAVV